MRRRLCFAASALVMVALCAFYTPAGPGESRGEKVFAEALPSLFRPQEPDTGAKIRVYLESAGDCAEMALEEYVSGVVLAEMPVTYAREALKAQAVAARTYALQKSRLFAGEGCARFPEADVCASSACCQGYADAERAWEKFGDDASRAMEIARKAALETAGEVCAFHGRPIRAMYHACAGGHTEDAENVYSEALAYLRGVPSPGEEAYGQYENTETIGLDALREAFSEDGDAQILDTIPLSEQLQVLERSDTGRVLRMRVGLNTMSGNAFRRKLGLKSSIFEIAYQTDAAVFKTFGYGHGVGMSQTGADAMARGGAGYIEILKWYYAGVEIAPFETLLGGEEERPQS